MTGVGLRLVVEYDGVAGLRRDWDAELKMGGFFAAIGAPPDLPPFAEVDLVLRADGADPVATRGRLTVANPTSVCLEILPGARPALAAAVFRACGSGVAGGSGERRRVRFGDGDEETPAGPAEPAGEPEGESAAEAPAELEEAAAGGAGARRRTLRDLPPDAPMAHRIAVMSIGEKVQTAVHGDAEARLLLARERTAGVQLALLKNPKLGMDEVMALARSSVINPEAVEAICRHQAWGASPQVALMLVRNPKVPITIATSLVGKLREADLRIIAKGTGVRQPIAAAARKRIMG